MMRAPLSGSTGSEDVTGEGSRDGSMRCDDSRDSDELRAQSGRVTKMRSARQRPKRPVSADEV